MRAAPQGFIVLAALLAFGSAHAGTPRPVDPTLKDYEHSHELVSLADGRRIHLYCLGKGKPVVLLTAGQGDWLVNWRHVQGAIAERTRTCSWDRPGFGFSDPSPDPQDSMHTTADLEAALGRAHIHGPFVLVGHSLGSYESLLFADHHPRDVQGMVLIDPSSPDQDRRMRKSAPKLFAWTFQQESENIADLMRCRAGLVSGELDSDSPELDSCFSYPPTYPLALKDALRALDVDPNRIDTEISEFQEFAHSAELVVNEKRNYGRMPLIVLTAGSHQLDAPQDVLAQMPRFEREWKRTHDQLAALSKVGVNRRVSGADHYIQNDDPEAVIDAVNEVLDKAAKNPKRH